MVSYLSISKIIRSIMPAQQKPPRGMPLVPLGPTTAGRMDGYVDLFQKHGGSMVMLAKGNRSQQVTDACKAHGGFYLGICRRTRRFTRNRSHQKTRSIRIPRARYGSRVENTG